MWHSEFLALVNMVSYYLRCSRFIYDAWVATSMSRPIRRPPFQRNAMPSLGLGCAAFLGLREFSFHGCSAESRCICWFSSCHPKGYLLPVEVGSMVLSASWNCLSLCHLCSCSDIASSNCSPTVVSSSSSRQRCPQKKKKRLACRLHVSISCGGWMRVVVRGVVSCSAAFRGLRDLLVLPRTTCLPALSAFSISQVQWCCVFFEKRTDTLYIFGAAVTSSIGCASSLRARLDCGAIPLRRL